MKTQRAQTLIESHTAILPLAAGLLLFALLSVIGDQISVALTYPDIPTAVLFPPYAALAAALVIARPRDWVWYIVLAIATHVATTWQRWPLSWIILTNFANTTRALIAAALLLWLCGRPPRLNDLRKLAFFIVSAAAVAPAIGATIGTINLAVHGAAPSYWRPWSAWFVSNALTALTMMPACIVAFEFIRGWREFRVQPERVIEMVLLILALCVTCALAFLQHADTAQLALSIYAPLPVVIWAALRFGAGGASVAMSVIAFAAIVSVDRGKGPFLTTTPDGNIFALQLFLLLTSAPVLCLAAIATARQGAVQLYRSLLASLQDHIAILDANGTVIETNQAWRRFADRAEAKPFHSVRRGDSYVEACRCAAEQGDATAAAVHAGVTRILARANRRFEIEYEHGQDGVSEAYTVSIDVLERFDGGAVVTRANVTARRRAQREIEQQQRELSHLARVAVLGQLSGALAHELNQPLTAILANAGAARLLLQRQSPDLKHIAEIMDDIANEDERAAAVIRRFRALLKRGDMQVQRIDPRELIEDVIHIARTELATRYVGTTAVVDPSASPFYGDKVQLQQLLLNCVLNACDAMCNTAPANRNILLTAGADAAGTVHFAIRDRGTGIPSELVTRLFEPFVTTKRDGLGLGLSISRTIVAAHGGRIWAENNADGGATMHFIIPVNDPRDVATTARVMVLAGARQA